MASAQQTSSGGGWFSKLVLVLLLALAIGLYLQIVMVDDRRAAGEPPPQASVRVVESDATARPAAAPTLQDLPPDQMELIRRVFAPDR